MSMVSRFFFYVVYFFAFVLLFFATHASFSQDSNISIGTDQLKARAVLWLKGNGSNQGLLLPVVNNRGSFTGLNNGDDKGMLIYDLSDNNIYYWNGTAWTSTGGTGANQQLTLNGNTFTLTGAPASAFPLSSGTPTTGQALVWNGTNWLATSLNGDATGTHGANQVTGIKGKILPPLPSSSQALVYNGTAWVFQSITGTDSQTLLLAANTLSISGGNSVTLGTLATVNTVSGGVGGAITDATISAADLENGTIDNSKISVTANIDVNKLNGGATNNGKVLKVVSGLVTYADDEIGAAGTGDITAVNTGTGLIGGVGAGDANLSVDVGTTAGKIVQLDGTGKLPAVDGSQLTNLPGGTSYTAGTGISIAGSIITNTGDPDEANDITITTSAGGDLTGTFPNVTIGNNVVTNVKLANGIDGAKLVDATVTNTKLTNNAVTNVKIADDAVTIAKIGTAGLPDANKVLTTDASGNPQWSNATGGGDMLKATYDPTNINADAFNLANHTGQVATTQITDASVTNIKLGTGIDATKITTGTLPVAQVPALDVAKITTGLLPIARGGTNSLAVPTNGGIPYGTGTAYAFTDAGTSGQLLQSNGAAAPTWITVPVAISPANTVIRGNAAGTAQVASQIFDNGTNVGIGTTTPLEQLHIFNTGSPILRINNASSLATSSGIDLLENNGVYGTSASGFRLRYDGLANKFLITSAVNTTITDNFSIDRATGNVGIGTTTPYQNLSVQGGMNVDHANVNNGTVTPGLIFGGSGSLEGISSKRTAGGNQNGLDFYAGNINRMSITNSGNVVIDPVGASVGTIANGLVFGDVNSGEGIAAKRNAGGNQYGLDFYANGINRMSITNGGNVGIGTSSPTEKLHVNGNVNVNGAITSTAPGTAVNGSAVVGYGIRGVAGIGAGIYGELTNPANGNAGEFNGNVLIRNGFAIKPEIAGGTPFLSDGDNNIWFNWTGSGFQLWVDATRIVTFNNTGTTKNFIINHPDYPKEKYLVHTTLEGPENGVYYRGKGKLVNGEASIQLPEYFNSLTKDGSATVILTAVGKKPYLLSYDDFNEKSFMVYGTELTGEFSWEVKAERQDVNDLLVAPDKSDITVYGNGPYKYYSQKVKPAQAVLTDNP